MFCEVDIPDEDECYDNFVKVTDGSGGQVEVCGKTSGTWTSKDYRDIFVVVETQGESGSVKCIASCSKTPDRLRVK